MQEEKDVRTWSEEEMVISSRTPQLPFQKEIGFLKSIGWGQRKLFFATLNFINRYWDPRKSANPKIVYAGAAEGDNIAILSLFYPEFEFHLYDPREFRIKPTDKIKIYQQLFTDKDALHWAGRNDVYLLSDIRTGDYEGLEPSLREETIKKDMYMQMEWHKTIKPIRSLLKFRLPYVSVETSPPNMRYLGGTIMLQPWIPPRSTECRLVPFEDSREVDWDIKKYDSQMFWHDIVRRVKFRYVNPFTKTLDNIDEPELLNDYDSVLEAQILHDYLMKRTQNSTLTKIRDLSRLVTKELNTYTVAKLAMRDLRQKEPAKMPKSVVRFLRK